jgi:hypothetical protein
MVNGEWNGEMLRVTGYKIQVTGRQLATCNLLKPACCRQKIAGCHVQETRNAKKITFVLSFSVCRQENWFIFYCIFCAPL